ncbi:alpha/beta fold hydrolase [Polaromonas sp. OV174]|uniref:alpha/beta fold hydrolase n=1 Tax=Polaromonas sp. OV174 TaxID=1855300 RepID=UPI000B84ABA4|nr:alpha/beta fold hydrolase [Polaromonas sp. OV174]
MPIAMPPHTRQDRTALFGERPLQSMPGCPRIAYEYAGAGETIVFLHGIGGNRSNWAEQLQHFSRQYKAVAWDARGYGNSDDYNGPCDFNALSQDLVRLLDHLEVDKAHCVGLSMGGRILMDFCANYPERVQSLVLAGSFPSFGRSLGLEQRQEFIRLRREPLQAGKKISDMATELIASLAGPYATNAMLLKMRQSIEALHPDSYLKTLESTLSFDRTAALALIRVPTLLLYGEFDTLVTPSAGKQVQALMPNAQYHVIRSVGHLMNIEAPVEFNRVVGDFVLLHARACAS